MNKRNLEKKIILALYLGIVLGAPSAYAADITLGVQNVSLTNTMNYPSTTYGYSVGENGTIDTTNGSITETVNNSSWVGIGGSASAYGFYNTGYNVTLTGTTVLPITATATGGTATYGDASAFVRGILNSGTTTITGNTNIMATATGGIADGDGVGIVSVSAGAYGIENNGTTTIAGNTNITATATGGTAYSASASAYGIANDGTTTINGNTAITAMATGGTAGAYGVNMPAYAYGIENNGTTTITGNTNITATATGGTAYSYALYNNSGTININQAMGNPYTVRLTGDVAAKSGSNISLNLNNSSSFLRGNVLGNVNIMLANDALWQPVYDNRNGTFNSDNSIFGGTYSTSVNTIQTLNLSGGIIDLSWDNASRTTSRNLTINTLSGTGGTVKLNTDIANGTGDKVNIGALSAASNLGVAVAYDPSFAAIGSPITIYTTGAGYTPVTVTTGAANLTLNGAASESGAYAITLNFTGTKLTSISVGTSSNTKSAASAANGQSEMSLLSTNHLRKRLGDLRNDASAENGIWARTYGGEITNDKYDKVESRYNGLQVGYDHKIQGKTGQSYTGGAVSYTASNDSYSRGTGTSKATDFAIYQTWLGNDGHYYDIIAKHGYLDSDYGVTDLSNNYSSASYKTQTNSLSAEYGYRKQLSNNWYIEPQSELTYAHINSVNYTTSSNMNVEQGGIDRLIGRIGLGLGKKLDNGNHIYTSLSMLHEFKGEENIKASSLNYNQDLSGTWGEFILGVDAKLSDHSTGYANVEKLFGKDVSSNWQFNTGCRFTF